jgi:hypothetical protein
MYFKYREGGWIVRKVLLLAGIFFFLVSFSGCKSEPTISPLVSSLDSPIEDALPSPDDTDDTPPALPSPSTGLAVISGRVIDLATNKRPSECIIYLGDVQHLDTGKPVVSLDQKEDLYAIPAENGWFIFSEVPPGDYGVILFNPDVSFLLEAPDNSGSLIIEVEPGQVLRLGTIKVSMP